MNNTKLTFGCLIVSFILKMLLNVPSMNICHKLGIDAYYGPIILTLLIQVIISIFILIVFKRQYQTKYRSTVRTIIKVTLSLALMTIVILIVKLFYVNTSLSRLSAIIEVAVYAIIGSAIYLASAYKTGLINDVFGKEFLNSILIKLKLKKA